MGPKETKEMYKINLKLPKYFNLQKILGTKEALHTKEKLYKRIEISKEKILMYKCKAGLQIAPRLNFT